jgi:hypothetical protein
MCSVVLSGLPTLLSSSSISPLVSHHSTHLPLTQHSALTTGHSSPCFSSHIQISDNIGDDKKSVQTSNIQISPHSFISFFSAVLFDMMEDKCTIHQNGF